MSVLFVTMAAAAAFGGDLSHSVAVNHGAVTATAVYVAKPAVSTRNIGLSAGTRPSSLRCLWTAEIGVTRHLQGENAMASRSLASDKVISGSRPGRCSDATRAINAEVASRLPEIKTYLAEVAAQDEQVLRKELDALKLASVN